MRGEICNRTLLHLYKAVSSMNICVRGYWFLVPPCCPYPAYPFRVQGDDFMTINRVDYRAAPHVLLRQGQELLLIHLARMTTDNIAYHLLAKGDWSSSSNLLSSYKQIFATATIICCCVYVVFILPHIVSHNDCGAPLELFFITFPKLKTLLETLTLNHPLPHIQLRGAKTFFKKHATKKLEGRVIFDRNRQFFAKKYITSPQRIELEVTCLFCLP